MDQGEASWAEIADGTLCGQDPDEIGVPARWPLDGTEDEPTNSLTPSKSSLAHAPPAMPG
ncbi:hypothetical protein M440DRAFT_1425638 [Trichoderma longibrachiatum ATCC 18648]|uniref:Uncharacterized protein n=1 Tax=Trichoderma longibrachiatum ATCC 18648 TaxID=983965 RepID=A0A2T4BT78_TRILO|nr:hypothetical protein M440DRAFT_1425638 [Trichoderma longibrachiatum ATCC 18648]